MTRPAALIYDVFGTLTDWRGSIAAEGAAHLPGLEWEAVAADWMKEYGRGVARLGGGWGPLDAILEAAFDRLMRAAGLDPAACPGLASAWSRLRAWPDALAGMARLRGAVPQYAFSNANDRMLASLAAASGLPFDGLISGEPVRAYKPDPKIYQHAAATLGRPPAQIMLVAAHCFDLNAARAEGFRTALVTRTGEPGSAPAGLDHAADLVVPDGEALAAAVLARPPADPE